jgi:hypothetical protein
LPDAPQAYKVDVVQLMIRAFQGEDITKDEDDNDDDRDDDADAAPNGVTAAQPLTVVPSQSPTATA